MPPASGSRIPRSILRRAPSFGGAVHLHHGPFVVGEGVGLLGGGGVLWLCGFLGCGLQGSSHGKDVLLDHLPFLAGEPEEVSGKVLLALIQMVAFRKGGEEAGEDQGGDGVKEGRGWVGKIGSTGENGWKQSLVLRTILRRVYAWQYP